MLWRYWCSPAVLGAAIKALPGIDPSHDRGHASFRFESDIVDLSLIQCGFCAPETPEGKIRYIYRVDILHIQGSVIAMCCGRNIAWSIRNRFFQSCHLGTVELDIEKLSHEHRSNVERLHCRMENNPELSDVILEGSDVMRSELFRNLGSSTYLSVTLKTKFDQSDGAGVFTCSQGSDSGTLLSTGLRGAFPLNTEVSATCPRSGTVTIEPSIALRDIITFTREILKYEQRISDWQG